MERYEDLGLIGLGGMGEVRRVRDRELNRVVAMKVIRSDLLTRPAVLSRFLEEAQLAGQLQHPGVAPVHELGHLPDGRAYFTMKEVRGNTLTEVVRRVHQVSASEGWMTHPTGWTLHRLVDAFEKVCEAVGYAHSRGLVHRDLKPDNVMIGAHGEVLVLDWGLAKLVDSAGTDPGDPIISGRGSDDHGLTRVGAIVGTPAFMAPEQARGAPVDARADVYGLGAILYEILAGRPPYEGADGASVVRQVLSGPPRPPGIAGGARFAHRPDTFAFDEDPPPDEAPAAEPAGSGPPLPAELVALCAWAMAREPEDRPADGAAVAAEVRAWLEGTRRRDAAMALVEQADAARRSAEAALARAAALRIAGADLLAGVARWEAADRKAPGWALEDEATRLARDASLVDARVESLLQAALTHAPDLPEAHAALAERHRDALAGAEQAGDADVAARAELRLRSHADALPERHPLRRELEAWLVGDGALTLLTEPPGAEVALYRYETRERRLVAVPVRGLGATPLRAVPLPMGSYLCVVRHPDRAEVRYPVHIARGLHWDGVPPGGSEPRAVYLPRPDELGPDDQYVPAGWYRAGDPAAPGDAMARSRVWCDGLVARRFPVTNREYVAFLDDLVANGREADALAYVPREHGGAPGVPGAMLYRRDEAGRFGLGADSEGDVWLPDGPVQMVSWACAAAFCAWAAERTGLPWRLPVELEWEKAARGVDGRLFPWGDFTDPSWCCVRESHAGRPLWAPVDSFPVDCSVYGVRGTSGNVCEWCADVYRKEAPWVVHGAVAPAEPGDATARRPGRGGGWAAPTTFSRCGYRYGFDPSSRHASLGFRMVRSLDPPRGQAP